MAKFVLQKNDKNNLRIKSKPHAYFQKVTKTPVKFQQNRYKIVEGILPTRYPLSVHFVIDSAGKLAKFNLYSTIQKVTKTNLQTTCISSDNDQNTNEVSKESVLNCRRSCAHKVSPD